MVYSWLSSYGRIGEFVPGPTRSGLMAPRGAYRQKVWTSRARGVPIYDDQRDSPFPLFAICSPLRSRRAQSSTSPHRQAAAGQGPQNGVGSSGFLSDALNLVHTGDGVGFSDAFLLLLLPVVLALCLTSAVPGRIERESRPGGQPAPAAAARVAEPSAPS